MTENDRLPKLPSVQIKKYKQAGQWPPPAGLIIFPQIEPSKGQIETLLESLALSVPEIKTETTEKTPEKKD